MTAAGLLRRFIDGLNRKYATGYSVEFLDVAVNACFRLRSAVAFGIDAADFTGSPTCWSFPAERPTR